MPDIRAVATDLDGTVLDEERRASPASLCAAADLAARGIPLILATDRSPAWVRTLGQLLPSVSVAVCCGGAVGWRPATAEVLWRDTIPTAEVDGIVRSLAQRLPEAGIATYDGERWRVTGPFALSGPLRPGPRKTVRAERISEYPACVMSLSFPGEGLREVLRALPADMQPPCAGGASSAIGVIDLGPTRTDKGTGVRRALEKVDVDPSHTVAFGNAPNDLPMFALCGYTVAVGNGHRDVTTAATTVAECVHKDGFARGLAQLGLVRAYTSDEAPVFRDCDCPN